MKLFDYAKSQDIEQLQKQIDRLTSQVKELQDRVYVPHYYGAELYINDAVQAIAEHLGIQLEGMNATINPRKAVVKPNKRTK